MSNCHKCQFKKSIPGNCHISCGSPKLDSFYEKVSNSPELSLLSMIPLNISTNIEKIFGLEANEHGVKSGWCFFPFNYDPVWLKGECTSFKEVEK